jgi:hypothetical protein
MQMANVRSAAVRARLGQTAYKRQLAYERLGVNPKDVECAPFLRTDQGASLA